MPYLKQLSYSVVKNTEKQILYLLNSFYISLFSNLIAVDDSTLNSQMKGKWRSWHGKVYDSLLFTREIWTRKGGGSLWGVFLMEPCPYLCKEMQG